MTADAIYRRIERPDSQLVARAAACPMSDLYEAMDAGRRDAALMSPAMRPLVPRLRIAGPAVTARCAPRDNLMMHRALLLAEPGDVLVVQAEEPAGAQWGMLAAVYAEQKKLAAVIVDGCIRDVDDLRERQFPVWFTAVSPAHPDKRGPGAVNVPIVCGGVDVHPGDVICADGDGVLVIRPSELAAAVARAEDRQRREQIDIEELKAGRSLFEIHALERALAQCGVPEFDGALPRVDSRFQPTREDNMLRIYGAAKSRALRTLWMVGELGLAYEHKNYLPRAPETRTPEFLAIEPNGRVPVIDDDGFVLSESMAINFYLAKKHKSPLYPADPKLEALALQWSLWETDRLDRQIVNYIRHSTELPAAERKPEVAAAAWKEVEPAFDVLETALRKSDWLAGPAFSVADLNVASALFRALSLDLAKWPHFQKWLNRCWDRPAAKKARAMREQ